MEALGINGGYLLVQIVSFIVIYTLLTRFVYEPLTRTLRERREKIAKGVEDAAKAENARLNAEAEAEKILQQARAEAQQIIEEARGRGEEVAKQVETEARLAAEKTRHDAREEASHEVERQLGGLRSQVAQIATAMARQIVGESLDDKRQKALVADFFSKVPAGAKGLAGNVEVVSAMPLTDAEQTKAKKELGADNVTFRVDPNILGGLIVRSGDRVVDGSVRSGLTNISARLN